MGMPENVMPVTGAGSRIGRAAALRLGADGVAGRCLPLETSYRR